MYIQIALTRELIAIVIAIVEAPNSDFHAGQPISALRSIASEEARLTVARSSHYQHGSVAQLRHSTGRKRTQ